MSAPVILDTTGTLSSASLFITRFDINSRADLIAVDTTLFPVGTVFQFITGVGRSRITAMAELQAGPADPADVSEAQPTNYDVASNNKHWQVVSGYLP